MGDDWVLSIEEHSQPRLGDWVKRIQREFQSEGGSQSQQPCIYTVPARLKTLHAGAYEPYMVSLGPYHHANPNLKPMEKHKHRALLQFLRRAKATNEQEPEPLAAIVKAVTAVVEQLKRSYEGLDDLSYDLDSKETKEQLPLEDGFLQLMIVDGCFVLEVLRVATAGQEEETGYEKTDPVFSNHGRIYMMAHLRRDMLMLENQLPMLALTTLAAQIGLQKEQLIKQIRTFYGLTNNSASSDMHADMQNKHLIKQIQTFFCGCLTNINSTSSVDDTQKSSGSNKTNDDGLHILHEYIKCKTQKGTFLYTKEDMMWSATELREGGVRFRKSGSDSFKDINFDTSKGILSLPRIEVDDSTESLLLNLMAFEQLHVGVVGEGNVVTSYVCLMDTLIDSAKDVELLRKEEIVQGWVGSDENVASLFTRVPKEASINMHNKPDGVNNQLSHYRNNILHRWRASFVHTYLRNPWVFSSLLGAVILLFLTIFQDVYTALPYYANKDSPPPPSS